MGTGLIIGGIVLIIIGVFALMYGTYIHGIQSTNIQECRSFTGELSQFFDSESSEICQRAPSIVMISLTAIIAGIVMIVIGGILSAIGVIRRPSPVGKTARVQVPSDNANRREEKDKLNGIDNDPGKSSGRDSPSLADELSKFVKLKEQGVLSEEEFARIKKDLLNGKS